MTDISAPFAQSYRSHQLASGRTAAARVVSRATPAERLAMALTITACLVVPDSVFHAKSFKMGMVFDNIVRRVLASD